MLIQNIQNASQFSIATSALLLGFLMIVHLAWIRGTCIPALLISLTDSDRRKITLSYVVFITLCGIGYLEHFIGCESGTRCSFAIVNLLTAIAGWEMVIVSVYYRSKTYLAMYN